MILAEREKNDREQNVTATQIAGVIIAFWRGFATGTAILFILAITLR